MRLANTRQSIEDYLKVEALMNEFFQAANYCIPECTSQAEPKVIPPNLINEEIPPGLGCCDSEYHNSFEFVFDSRIRTAFLKERRELYGRIKPNRFCGYHSSEGCRLKTHKSPRCLVYVCTPFKNYLKNNFDIDYYNLIDEEKFDAILNGDFDESWFERLKDNIKGWIEHVHKD